jgi:hypothetical protein
MTDEQKFLEKIATKAANILHMSLGEIDPAKLLHMYSCLSVLFGSDEELMIHWISTYNNHLKFCPAAHLTDARMDDTIRYLEAMVEH